LSKVSDFRPAKRNANRHTARGLGALQNSVQADGWIGAMTTAADGDHLAVSARIETAAQVFGVDAEPIVVESDGTRPIVVVRKDIPNAEDPRAVRLGLADNRVQELDLSWDPEVLCSFDAATLEPLFSPEELSDLGRAWAGEQARDEEKDIRHEVKGIAARTAAKTLVDLIWTQTDVGCCLATHMGFLYGIQSPSEPCPCATPGTLHDVAFIDNTFKKYSHQRHLEWVKRFRPKYCTVRDIMTRQQCEEAGIEYYDMDQVLSWASDLEQYAQNVIVIPKYDCLKDIPERFMLGYSVPTTYGGTPLPIELFRGRRVHLLGGNPEVQIAYYQKLPESVVSLDNNQMHLRAEFGNTWSVSGYRHLQSIAGNEGIATQYGLWPSVALSLAHFASYFTNVAGSASPAE